MTWRCYNIIVVITIPNFVHLKGAPWPVLPAGIHAADLNTIQLRFACNPWRRRLFSGLWEAARNLAMSGCRWL